MDYVISSWEYQQLIQCGTISNKIVECWQNILQNLPSKLRQEANKCSFKLIPHPVLQEAGTKYSKNLAFYAHSASPELNQALAKVENTVICLIDS